MRLGINSVLSHTSPTEWAENLRKLGLGASVFPVDYKSPVSVIDSYVKVAEDYDICIAEVGVWNNLIDPNLENAEKNRKIAEEQLRLADYVKANCCVNFSGADGPIMYSFYKGNYTQEIYDKNVEVIQRLCDAVKPKNTYYTLEIMQWMIPESAQQYNQFIKDVNRECFAVHMDAINLISNPYTYTHHNEVMDKAFDLLGDKIKSCHIKDAFMEPRFSVCINEVPCGEGIVDHVHYAKRIEELNPNLPLLLEHCWSDEAFIKGFDYLRPLFQNAGILLK